MRKLLPLFTTLRGRLTLLVCFATLPALLFTFYVAHNERSAALRRMEEDAHHLAGLAAREHAHQLQGAAALVRRLCATLAHDDSLPARDGDFLAALLAGAPQFANIFLVAPDGSVLHSAHPLDDNPSMAHSAVFARALHSDDVEVGSYVIGELVRKPVLQLARAVRGPGGEVRQVVFVAADLRWLQDLSRQVRLPPESWLLIADREDHVLAHSDASSGAELEVGTRITGLTELSRRQGGKVLTIGDTGRTRYFLAAPMDGVAGVSVVAALPYENVVGEANRAFARTLGVLAALTLSTLILALVAVELSVLRSLRSLSRAAGRFGEGDLSVRADLPAGGGGELRDLAASFNTMADALAARHRQVSEARDQLRALSGRLHVAREEEAGRITRELHDEIGQVLTSLKLDLARLRDGCLREQPCAAALDQNLTGMCGRIDGAVDFVRRIASELRPAVLDRLGLAAALELQAGDMEARTELFCTVEVSGIEEPLDPLVAITIFRIAQEAMTNVARHAAATEVRVELLGHADEIELTVTDNGRGIDPDAAARVQSLGIAGMRERALLVGGKIEIHGRPGRGTAVRLRLPRAPAAIEGPGTDHAHPAG